MYLAAECFVRLQICTCQCAHVVSFIPCMVTWSRWNEGGNRMTNIYKGQQAEGELRLEAATSMLQTLFYEYTGYTDRHLHIPKT